MNMQEGWIILRCAGRSTLKLADSLAADGFEVWTPTETQRARGRRGKECVPIMPTFVFARVTDPKRQIRDFAELAEDPQSSRPAFSLFRYYDRTPVIGDAELAGLRDAETRAIPLDQRPSFETDAEVKATRGPYEGMSGKVERCKNGYALVLFGWHRVKISTFILQPISAISRSEAHQRTAAKAA